MRDFNRFLFLLPTSLAFAQDNMPEVIGPTFVFESKVRKEDKMRDEIVYAVSPDGVKTKVLSKVYKIDKEPNVLNEFLIQIDKGEVKEFDFTSKLDRVQVEYLSEKVGKKNLSNEKEILSYYKRRKDELYDSYLRMSLELGHYVKQCGTQVGLRERIGALSISELRRELLSVSPASKSLPPASNKSSGDESSYFKKTEHNESPFKTKQDT